MKLCFETQFKMYWSRKVCDLMLNDRHTGHQRKKTWPRRHHRLQRIQRRHEQPSNITSLFPLLSFRWCTSHQHTKQPPPFAASAALSYTSSMVKSTWKEKHHVVTLEARFIQILTCTHKKAGKCPLCAVLSLCHLRLWWAGFEIVEVGQTNYFLIYFYLRGQSIYTHNINL